jgi:hypothetical protein
MLKRIFIIVVLTGLFFVAMQFVSVFFYAWEFDDFVRDELRFAPAREHESKEHLAEHIKEEAQYYGLSLKDKDIVIHNATDTHSGITTLSADVSYTTPVDLYYFSYELQRHVHATAMY